MYRGLRKLLRKKPEASWTYMQVHGSYYGWSLTGVDAGLLNILGKLREGHDCPWQLLRMNTEDRGRLTDVLGVHGNFYGRTRKPLGYTWTSTETVTDKYDSPSEVLDVHRNIDRITRKSHRRTRRLTETVMDGTEASWTYTEIHRTRYRRSRKGTDAHGNFYG